MLHGVAQSNFVFLYSYLLSPDICISIVLRRFPDIDYQMVCSLMGQDAHGHLAPLGSIHERLAPIGLFVLNVTS